MSVSNSWAMATAVHVYRHNFSIDNSYQMLQFTVRVVCLASMSALVKQIYDQKYSSDDCSIFSKIVYLRLNYGK